MVLFPSFFGKYIYGIRNSCQMFYKIKYVFSLFLIYLFIYFLNQILMLKTVKYTLKIGINA